VPRQHARRYALRDNFNRELIQQTAYSVLVSRVIIGLATWILFNEVFLPTAPGAWPVHLVFLGYFVANSTFCLEYRAGRVSTRLVLVDLLVNLLTVTTAIGCTGGIDSPVVLVILFKIAGYAFIYGPATGIVSIAVTFASAAGLGLGQLLGLWSVVPIDAVVPELQGPIEFAFRATILGMILVGAAWFFNQVVDKEREVGTQERRAQDALDQARAAASVTSALLAVSEAVSRLTRLDEILIKVVDVAPRVLEVDYCGIFLWNEETETYRGAAVSGVDGATTRDLLSMRLTPAEVPDLEWVRRLGHCAVIAPRGLERLGAPSAAMLLTAPLLSGGRFFGVLQFARWQGHAGFTQRDLTIADGIAGQTAVALERSRLTEESRRLVRAVESTSEAVLITDRHRRIVFANPAFLSNFGYTWDEVQGRDGLSLNAVVSGDQVDAVQEALQHGNWRGEVTGRRKDGTTFPAALHVNLIRAADDGRLEGSVAIIEDVSEDKRLQEQLTRSDRLAAAGQFAAGVAHEVNNALVGILGQTELARDAGDVATLREALGRIDTQGRRIAEIIQQLVGFARPRPPERGPVDLRILVRDTLNLMAHDLGRSRIRSETRFPPDLAPVPADAQQLQQVLVNLFTNAMQAMRPDGGTLTVSLRAATGAVVLDVQDTGPGIAPEALSRVFDPFFSTKTEGTGLGLSVSYAIVNAHGGTLSARSAPDVPTTFTLALPTGVEEEPLTQRSALLVDDDPDVADTLTDMLRKEGLTVRRAATGSDALRILADEEFDAIFLDLRLPDISGQEVFQHLATTRPDQARRVAFVTGGLWRLDNRELQRKLPAQPTLSKPCTSAQIRGVLRALRDQERAAA